MTHQNKQNAQISKAKRNVDIAMYELREKINLLFDKMQYQNEIIADLRAEIASSKFSDMAKPNIARNKDILDSRNNGARFVDLAKKYGLSSSRVQQIYNRQVWALERKKNDLARL
jgi:Mor family transcriptional regulator